ncbi:MAG TPA: hypothetical protein VHY35_24495 [Stellaceae bacterium]|jgi:preprotein translocase subunit SecA|nr:hypothetical protein [Stellaceae bacterium]
MSRSSLALPPLTRSVERAEPQDSAFDRVVQATASHAVAAFPRLGLARLRRFAKRVAAFAAALTQLSDAELRRDIRVRAAAVRRSKPGDMTPLAPLFAGIGEAAFRTLQMRPFPVQVMGACALWDGRIAEMATGEGKTVTAALCAAAAALSGAPVHVVTVNDYLAERDAESMAPLYDFLGLGVGVVTGASPRDARGDAYRQPIAYCTNKELVFDYLRDGLRTGERRGNLQLKIDALYGGGAPLLQGLHFAIVDEADSVLIDEARMPLILSGETEGQIDGEMADAALDIAQQLEAGRDWHRSGGDLRIDLTDAGIDRLVGLAEERGGSWAIPLLREELVRHALSALHLFRRDEHYLVRDGKVEIIDEFTGRVMPDRQWTDGLHQMVERKEGCAATTRRVPLARLTYQRFFRRYRRLSGMTGTAAEVARELWWVYGLRVVRIPTNRPCRRVHRPDRVVAREAAKWQALATRVAALHRAGAPVLVGTRTVQASLEASRHLTAAGVPHAMLNAAQDQSEAEIVAAAGQPGHVTVATNMAGRGTDIRLGDGVAALGGLHVVMTERHDARRIDRQLAGRSGRQGDPGSFETVLSLDDAILQYGAVGGPVLAAARFAMPLLGSWAGLVAIRWAQLRLERVHFKIRRDLLRADRASGEILAFAGRGE